VIDDAAAMAAGGWAVATPAQVVERATVDAQELGGLVDGEKGRVVIVVIVIVEHESGLHSSMASICVNCRTLGSSNVRGAQIAHPSLHRRRSR
jgi:hypothetical protein